MGNNFFEFLVVFCFLMFIFCMVFAIVGSLVLLFVH